MTSRPGVTAVAEPPGPLAVTAQVIVDPMSEGWTTYRLVVPPAARPLRSQAKVNDVESDQTPRAHVNVLPGLGLPLIDGFVVAAGAGASCLAADVATADPMRPAALTWQLIAAPASAGVS